MRSFYSVISVLFLICFVNESNADYPVSTDPQLRNVVLEEYTGIYCGYCVAGHKISEEIMTMYPNRVFTINVHMDKPGVAGRPDFTTKWGINLKEATGFSGIPHATVNREVFVGGITGLARNLWSKYTSRVLSQTSPVNIGARATWLTNRTFKVDVELYFRESTPPDNLLNIALLESGVIGYQASGGDEYEHNHILRNMHSQWGVIIPESSEGTLIKKTLYINTVDSINPWKSDLDIVVYLSQNNRRNIYTGTQIHIEEAAPEEAVSRSTVSLENKVGSVGTKSTGQVTLTNKTQENITFVLRAEKSETVPDDWTCKITGHNDSEIVVPAGAEVEINAEFIIGSTPGYGTMLLNAAQKIGKYLEPNIAETMFISTDYKELFVSAAYKGAIIGSMLEDSPYKGIPQMPFEIFDIAVRKFSKLNTLIWEAGNAGHFDQKFGEFIARVLNNGGNAVLLGNNLDFHFFHSDVFSYLGMIELGSTDIGKDSAPFTVTGMDGDPISSDLIVNYPSERKSYSLSVFKLLNSETSAPFIRFGEDCKYIKYIDNVKTYVDLKAEDAYFGFRYEKDNQRIVYMAESPNIINHSEVANDLTMKILEYVAGNVSVEEFDKACTEILAVPNPFANSTEVYFDLNSGGIARMSLIDAQGNKIQDYGSEMLSAGPNKKQISSENLQSGAYFLVIEHTGRKQVVKLMINK